MKVKIAFKEVLAAMWTRCCTVVAPSNERPPRRRPTVARRSRAHAAFADNRGTPGNIRNNYKGTILIQNY